LTASIKYLGLLAQGSHYAPFYPSEAGQENLRPENENRLQPIGLRAVSIRCATKDSNLGPAD